MNCLLYSNYNRNGMPWEPETLKAWAEEHAGPFKWKDGEGLARCRLPSHDGQDRNPSFSFNAEKGAGRCFACHMAGEGLSVKELAAAWGAEMPPMKPAEPVKSASRIVAAYDYVSAKGELVYQSCRYDPKGFRQRRPDGNGGWIWDLKGVNPLPYRLPELTKAFEQNKVVFVTEGEKDVDQLRSLGITATTNSGGAGKWTGEHSEYFPEGSKVIILPDNDQPGRNHAQEVARSLHCRGCSVKVVELPGLVNKGDVSDWLDEGNTKEDLIELCNTAQEWTPETAPEESKHGRGIICLADVEREEVDWLLNPYIPLGKLTIVQGDPGIGKTFFVADIAARITTGRALPLFPGEPLPMGTVIFQTGEDGLADTLRPRFESLGADLNKIFIIDESENALSFKDLERLEAVIKRHSPKLLVFDPIQAYLGADVDMNRANQIRPVMKQLGNLAAQYKTAIVLIGRLNKNAGGKAIYRNIGSIDLPAVARSMLLVGCDQDDKSKRAVIQTKSSLSVAGPAMGFSLDVDNGFQWTSLSDLTEEKLLGMGRVHTGKSENAESILRAMLSDGPKPVKEIMQAVMAEVGCSEKTVQNASKSLSIQSIPVREANKIAHYLWSMSDAGELKSCAQ